MKTPNVLLLIADDWSPLAACYGDSVVRTPNIDRLADRGMTFTQAFCTTPSCSASRANILTGLYSHQHRQYGHSHGSHHFRTREDASSLPAVLQSSGMVSFLSGKSHIAPASVYPFTDWREPTESSAPLFSNAAMAKGTRACLEQANGRPFYMHVASGYPHRIGGYFDTTLHAGEFTGCDVACKTSEVPVPAFLPDTAEVRDDLAAYYLFIARFDEFVGIMLNELDRSGLARDTLVILLSDHGMPFPGAKASPFEAGHHCPLIIAHPDGLGAGTRCNALVNWCDIMPTVLAFMQVPPERQPGNLTGRSLLPLLKDPQQEWSDVTFYSHSFHEVTNYFPYRVVRGKRYKYVRCLASQLPLPLGMDLYDSPSYASILKTGGSSERSLDRLLHHWPEALFDLDEDPYETTNLIDKTALRPIVEDYRQRLSALRFQTDDPWLEIDYQDGLIAKYRE